MSYPSYITEALSIAKTAVPFNEPVIQGMDRVVYGFDAAPGLHVVADRNASQMALALLLIEQLTLIRLATNQALIAAQLQNMPGAGGVQ
tara:strand:- start:43992 stop:44258 length:267 start_codon:yes stop_codon:yes gene_type:complete